MTSAEEYGLQELDLKDVVDVGIPLDAALDPFGRDVRIALADVDDGGEHGAGVFGCDFMLWLSVICAVFSHCVIHSRIPQARPNNAHRSPPGGCEAGSDRRWWMSTVSSLL